MLATVDFTALGTDVRILASDPGGMAAARREVERELAAVDLACSRFRDDSELQRLRRARVPTSPISPLLAELIGASLRAARLTGGAVSPTVGSAMRRIGYDRDFRLVPAAGGRVQLRERRVPDWQLIELDERRLLMTAPVGLELDLGSTAKAVAADRAAAAAARAAGCGVLVSLGGDIAMAGPPPAEGWGILVTDDHSAPLDGPGQVVFLTGGGLATSSTTVRRWTRGDVRLHHIVDPATGLPAAEHWRTVSVGAATCVDANTAATAAIVWGDRAPAWLAAHHLPARLVRPDGNVLLVAGWPEPEEGSA